MNRIFRHSKSSLLFIFIAPMLLFIKEIINNEIPYFMDVVAPFYSVKYFAAQMLKGGEFPLWNPTYFCGVPFFSNPQWGMLYPFTFLFMIFPSGSMWTLSQVLHFSIAGCGMFFLIKKISVGNTGAAIGSILFIFSGYFFAHLAFGAFLFAAAWIPWIWLSFETLTYSDKISKTIKTAAVCAFIIALQFLAGAPQIAFYSICSLCIFTFSKAVFSNKRNALFLFKISALIFIAALLISLPQILATRIFFSELIRSQGLDFETIKSGALSIKAFILSLAGGFSLPEDAETTMAITPLGIILFLFASFFAKKNKKVYPYFIIMAFSLFLTLDIFSKLLYYIFPPYRFFHDPKRARIIFLFALCVVTGTGLNRFIFLTALKQDKSRSKKIIRFFLPVTVLILSLTLIFFAKARIDMSFVKISDVYPNLKWTKIKSCDNNNLPNRIFSIDPTIHYTYAFRRKDFAQYLLPGSSPCYNLFDFQGYDPSKPERYSAYLSLINNGYVELHKKHFGIIRNPMSPLLARAGVKYVIGDVNKDKIIFPEQEIKYGKIFAARSDSPYFSKGIEICGAIIDPKEICEPHKTLGYLKILDSGNSIIFETPLISGKNVSNKKIQNRAPFTSNPDTTPSLTIDKGYNFGSKNSGNIKAEFDEYDYASLIFFPKPIRPSIILLDWTDKNSSFYISSIDMLRDNESLRFSGKPEYHEIEKIILSDLTKLSLFEIKNSSPFLEITTHYMVVNNIDEAISVLSTNPVSPAVVENTHKSETLNNILKPSIINNISTTSFRVEFNNNSVNIFAEITDDNSLLIHRQSFMKGWRCYVDGKKAMIYPVDILFQGVFLKKGKHEIIFKYFPF